MADVYGPRGGFKLNNQIMLLLYRYEKYRLSQIRRSEYLTYCIFNTQVVQIRSDRQEDPATPGFVQWR